MNLYTYVRNNPVRYVDPFGLGIGGGALGRLLDDEDMPEWLRKFLDELGTYGEEIIQKLLSGIYAIADRFHEAIGLDISGKYFNKSVYWSELGMNITESLNAYLVGTSIALLGPPPADIAAALAVFSAGTGAAIDAYKKAWVSSDWRDYVDPTLPVIKNKP